MNQKPAKTPAGPIDQLAATAMTSASAPRRGRPPKVPVHNGDTREAIVRAGVAILTEKGFSATAVDDVLDRAGVNKGSFYYYFKTKDAFGAVLIERYGEYFAQRLDKFFSNTSKKPLQRLKEFILDAEDGMDRYEFKRGCLVGNLGQEIGVLPNSFRRLLHDTLLDWQRRTAACLSEAKSHGQISAACDPDRLAEFFWIGWEGAVLRAKLERDIAPLRRFADEFFALIEIPSPTGQP